MLHGDLEAATKGEMFSGVLQARLSRRAATASSGFVLQKLDPR